MEVVCSEWEWNSERPVWASMVTNVRLVLNSRVCDITTLSAIVRLLVVKAFAKDVLMLVFVTVLVLFVMVLVMVLVMVSSLLSVRPSSRRVCTMEVGSIAARGLMGAMDTLTPGPHPCMCSLKPEQRSG